MHQHKINFTERFKKRIPLRLHMTLILLATGLSGLMTTRSLLATGVESIVIRYPLAVLFSYLVYFFSMTNFKIVIIAEPNGVDKTIFGLEFIPHEAKGQDACRTAFQSAVLQAFNRNSHVIS